MMGDDEKRKRRTPRAWLNDQLVWLQSSRGVRVTRLAARVTLLVCMAIGPVYIALAHGEQLGERLQYLGGKLRNAGAEATVVVEKPAETLSLREQFEAELETKQKDLDICRYYLEGALQIKQRSVVLPKPPKPGAARASGG